MKKVFVFILVIFCFSTAYSQDLIQAIQKLTLENDSLQKQVIKTLNDSIIKLNSAHTIEIDTLNKQIKTLESEKNKLNKEKEMLESSVADLSKNKIKIERDNLQVKSDTLANKVKELDSLINNKDMQIAQEKKFSKEKSIQENEKGKQQVLSHIIQTYNKSFDELIRNSTLKTVERDMYIVGTKTEVQPKLLSLQIYFNSELVLSEKYSEQKVEYAITQLKSIEQTEFVLKLTDKLSKYKLFNDVLKTTIDKILEIDKKFVANDEYTQKSKLNDVLYELAWYIRNFRFNFTDYPYLTEIVLEVIKLKQKDANTDIAFLKAKF